MKENNISIIDQTELLEQYQKHFFDIEKMLPAQLSSVINIDGLLIDILKKMTITDDVLIKIRNDPGGGDEGSGEVLLPQRCLLTF